MGAVAGSASSPRRIVIYDPDCGMCERTMRFVRACDWMRRLEILDYYSAAARFPEVAAHELDEGMQVRHPDGRVDIAIDAVRTTMLNTPPGMLVGWLLFIPGLRALGSRAYAHLAEHRTRSCVVTEAPDGDGRESDRFSDAPSWLRTLLVVAIAALFGTYLAIGFGKGELFPFSTFPMYSEKLTDPVRMTRMRIDVWTADGARHELDRHYAARTMRLTRSGSLPRPSETPPDEYARFMLDRINSTRLYDEPVVRVRMTRQRIQLAPYPADPLEPKVVHERLVFDSGETT